jgi:hypothetical protein
MVLGRNGVICWQISFHSSSFWLARPGALSVYAIYIGGIRVWYWGFEWFGFGDRGLVPSWLVFPATKTQSDVLGHCSAPHPVGLSLVRSSNLREKSAGQIALADCVTARSASERRPAFNFRYGWKLVSQCLLVCGSFVLTQAHTGATGPTRRDRHIFSLERQESQQFPKSHPLGTLWDARGAVLDYFVSTNSPRDTLTHLGSSRSANVGTEMLARVSE